MARLVPARRGLAVLALSAGIAVLAPGCGGHAPETKARANPPILRPQPRHYSRYETAMQALGNRLALALEQSGRAVNAQGATTAVIVQALRVAQRQLRASAVALARLRPPGKVKALHEELLTGVRQFAVELDTVIASARRGTDGVRIAATIPTLQGLKEMQRASDAIGKAGYVIVIHVHPG